jgi:anti-sigma factor RsiW
MSTTWHADPALLARYADDDLDDVRATSLEAHLLSCDACRERLTPFVAAEPLETVWQHIETTLDAPRSGMVERVLVRLGVHEHVARLLSATPSLRLSWFIAEAIALGSAAVAAHHGAGTRAGGSTLFLFLVVAALAPVAGVAAAFGPKVDPSYEIGIASPLRSDRLLFLRATAVLVCSLVIAGLAALALPGFDRSVVVWLLPALGLTLATLAVATWLTPITSACVVGLSWALLAAAGSVSASDPLALFHALAQIGYLLAIAASLLVLARRGAVYEGRIRI